MNVPFSAQVFLSNTFKGGGGDLILIRKVRRSFLAIT